MSDSSEDDDLSQFREVIDTSFIKFINESRGQPTNQTTKESKQEKPKSERYLEEASHYNDVKVPEEMQKRIWAKASAIIQKNITFVDMDKGIQKRKIKGGVKLFKGSEEFMSCEEAKDMYTANHNIESKKIFKNRRRHVDAGDEDINECGKYISVPPVKSNTDKITATAISGEYILSKKATKCWKSRRKEKILKFKAKKNNKVLTLIE